MGIFSRFRDIVSSNLNAMLDNAEDPEKMIKLMIGEIEDTLIELKASCAKVMADSKRMERIHDEVKSKAAFWEEKAELAVSKGRDDLAREALLEKRKYLEKAGAIHSEWEELNLIIGNYHDEIQQLEAKLEKAREKQRLLIQRHIQANKQIKARHEMHRIDSSDAIHRFDKFESRIEQLEAEAELAGHSNKTSLEKRFDTLAGDEEIDKELEALKARKETEK